MRRATWIRLFAALVAAGIAAGCTLPEDESEQDDEPAALMVGDLAYRCERPALFEEPACREYAAVAPGDDEPAGVVDEWPSAIEVDGVLYECTDWNTMEPEGDIVSTLPVGVCEVYTWTGELEDEALEAEA